MKDAPTATEPAMVCLCITQHLIYSWFFIVQKIVLRMSVEFNVNLQAASGSLTWWQLELELQETPSLGSRNVLPDLTSSCWD